MTADRHMETAQVILNEMPEEDWEAVHSRLAQALADAERDAIERSAEVAEAEHLVSGSIGPLMNVGWSSAQKSIAIAIRALIEDDEAKGTGDG